MIFGESAMGEVDLALVSRGSKSRNKVSVGEPAEGSVPLWSLQVCWWYRLSPKAKAEPGALVGT
jgi:hypothetical protein